MMKDGSIAEVRQQVTECTDDEQPGREREREGEDSPTCLPATSQVLKGKTVNNKTEMWL